ncbi:single-stranded DNA-binding protein [Bacillaceae bacterium SIJ1]|nr:single-stranded DNA-binding protein [Litoribacterium kuwaitense]
MVNQMLLVGRLTRPPELRYTTNEGVAMTRFMLAVNRSFKNNEGEYDVDFIPCTAWRTLAETTAEYCEKGSLVAVTGRLRSYTFESDNGQKVEQLEIVASSVQFLESKEVREKRKAQQTPFS